MDLEFQVYKMKNCWGGGVGREKEVFQDSENILYKTILTDTCHYTSVQTPRMSTTKREHDGNCALWVMTMCLCRLIGCN